MPKHSDAGIAKKIANMGKVITQVQTLGTTYKPGNSLIAVAYLNARYVLSAGVLDENRTDKTDLKNAIGNRQLVFRPGKNKSSRLLNYLLSLSLPEEKIRFAQGINRKISGNRKGGDKDDPTPPTEGTTGENSGGGGHSTSQQSFDNMVSHWEEWKTFLESLTDYVANEEEFTIAGVAAFIQSMKDANDAVNQAESKEANSRNRRDDVVVNDKDSIVNLGDLVKRYIRSTLKPNNPVYKQIIAIKF